MKSINKMAVVAALALSSAGVASAATYHVTGSTAFRVADVSAEVALIGAANAQAVYWGSSLTAANQSVVQASNGSIKFENSFSGSVGGVISIEEPIATSFPTGTGTETPTGPLTGVTLPSTPASGGLQFASGAPANTETVNPDIAYSDSQLATANAIIKSGGIHTTVSITAKTVGIIPFVFVANGTTDVYSKLSGLSMDPQKFTYAWSNGGAPLSYFTGVNGDEGTTVYPMGRDIDSGTRNVTVAEMGYNLGGSGTPADLTSMVQYYPYDSASDASNNTTTGVIGLGGVAAGATIGGINFVPEETVDGIDLPTGDGGYASGDNQGVALSTAFASGTTNTVLMGYLGASDAKAALTSGTAANRNPAVLMAYNGATFDPTSTAAANLAKIYEGQYTIWGTEQLTYTSAGAAVAFSATESAGAPTLHYELATAHVDQLSSGGIITSSMIVHRAGGDGSNIQ